MLIKKEMAVCLHLESILLITDTRPYSWLLHCSSAQLDSENQRWTRSHRGKRRLGMPSKRETEALVPLAEGRGAAAAPGRHRWSPPPGRREALLLLEWKQKGWWCSEIPPQLCRQFLAVPGGHLCTALGELLLVTSRTHDGSAFRDPPWNEGSMIQTYGWRDPCEEGRAK